MPLSQVATFRERMAGFLVLAVTIVGSNYAVMEVTRTEVRKNRDVVSEMMENQRLIMEAVGAGKPAATQPEGRDKK